ncbi:unnamed protein product [Paramecium primaurelia]|uniref:Uncharacterized protein n=1 Tax=Paramecium primaurelia TaxID=5886 RepID=A0A8S1KEZ0_PARPR|nr:unnamed protein product [Paramecium primaurelia]
MLNPTNANKLSTSSQALSKSVHFSLGNSQAPVSFSDVKVVSGISKSAIDHPQVGQVTGIDCGIHMKQLKGFCIEQQCIHQRRKLCVGCLWGHTCVHKVQVPEFVKLLTDKLAIAEYDFFDKVLKVVKKDHLQNEIDEMFLKIKMDFDNHLNDLYSQFMYWTKHGMGDVIKKGFLADFLLDDNVIEQIMELVLKGRAMEAEDETIQTCVELINADPQEIKLLPQQLQTTLVECEEVIRQTLHQLEQNLITFKQCPFDFKNVKEGVQIPRLRIPGTQGNIQGGGGFGFGGGFNQIPQTNFIGTASQLPKTSVPPTTTHFQNRFASGLASQLNAKLFIDARDLHQSQVWALCKISSQVIATGDWQGNIKIIGLTLEGQYQFMQSLNHGKNVYSLLLSDATTLISAGQNQKDEWTIKVWDLERSQLIKELKGHINYIFSLTQPVPGTLVSCSYDETVRVWNLQNGQCIKVFKEFKTSFNDLLSWNQEEIICCSDDKAIRLLNIQTGEMKMQLFDSCFVNGIARVSQNEIAVGNFKGEILIINVTEQKIVRRMGSHKSFLWRIKVIDKDLIASASFDKTIKIWEWQSGQLVASLEGHTDIVRSIELIEEIGFLVSTSDDKSIKVWRLI